MSTGAYILADGLTPGLVFGIAVFVIWVLGAILNQKPKAEDLKKPSLAARELAEARRRIREQQAAQKPALTPRIEQKRAKKQQKQRRQEQQPQQRPPALPTPVAIESSRTPMAEIATSAGMHSTQEIGSDPAKRREKSETAKNIRLMLQRNGIREAFVLGEVLGKPVAMRTE
jgi:hypothetical protein